MPTITLLERQKNHPERVNVYLDGTFAFGLNELDAAHLRKGQTLTADEVNRLQDNDAVVKAVDKGVNLLSFRPRSTQEIRQHLTKKGFPPPVIDSAIARLETLQYVNDEAFARFWVENRSAFKPLSQRALRYELIKKGVAEDVIQSVLQQTDEAESAQQAALSQARKLRGYTPQQFKQKLGQFLQRRGFGYGEVRRVTQVVLAQLMEDDPTFFALDES